MRLRLIAGLAGCLVVAASSTAIASEAGATRIPTKTAAKLAPKAYTREAVLDRDSPESAVLVGLIYNHGLPANFRFKWGRTKAYGKIAPYGSEEREYDGKRPVEVSEVIEGLRPDTTYHFQVVAYTNAGKSFGRDRTFHTPGRR